MDSRREVVVRIWYPVDDVADATPLPYFEDFTGELADQVLASVKQHWNKQIEGYPQRPDPTTAAFPSLIGSITYSFPGFPVSDEQSIYPVLIFSPAISMPEEYTFQMEQLASHGYVVVGINHPYVSDVTILSNGQIIISANLTLNDLVVQDIVFVIDQLEKLNADDPEGLFNERINLEQLGVFGYAHGGDAAVLAGRQDSRIRAVLSSGQPVGMTVAQLDQPYMYFTTNSVNLWSR